MATPTLRVLPVAVLYSILATLLISLVARASRQLSLDTGWSLDVMQMLVPAGLAVFVGAKELNAPYRVLLTATAIWTLLFVLAPYALSGSIPSSGYELVALYFGEMALIYLAQLPIAFAARKWRSRSNPSFHGTLRDETAHRP